MLNPGPLASESFTLLLRLMASVVKKYVEKLCLALILTVANKGLEERERKWDVLLHR